MSLTDTFYVALLIIIKMNYCIELKVQKRITKTVNYFFKKNSKVDMRECFNFYPALPGAFTPPLKVAYNNKNISKIN